MMKKLFLTLLSIICTLSVFASNAGNSSSTDTNNGTELESGLYLGVIGFNQELYTYPTQHLTDETKSGFDSFIDGLTMKDGTLLYYSVDEAISALQAAQLPSNLNNVAVVTFTDGLDRGSHMLNSSYSTDDEYLSAINKRIKTEKVGTQNITAYSVGIRGSDVTDIAKFTSNLQMIASTPGNATEVNNMSEVNARFEEIATQLIQTNQLQTITLRMPGQANGTKIRFTFDNVTNANLSQLYIEGNFNLTNKTLENVVYHGMTSSSGTTIQGTVDGIFVTFTFEDILTNSKQLISQDYINEWTYISSTNSWQINSEFDKNEESEIVIVKKSAAIILVLDNSSSLGSQFASVQENAKSFIATLLTQNEDSTDPDDGTGDSPNTTPDNLSTTPQDLTLAVWKDGTRYYITQEEYRLLGRGINAYTIEGLSIVSANGNYIIDLYDVCSERVIYNAASHEWGAFLPSQAQGLEISARMTDINKALFAFGGSGFDVNRKYWTSYKLGGNPYCISGSGGSLYPVTVDGFCYVRRVSSITSGHIYWASPVDLQLIAKNEGRYMTISQDAYRNAGGNISQFGCNEVVGIYVASGLGDFVLDLNNTQSSPITYAAASVLYGSYLPSDQGYTISARKKDINMTLEAFGGSKFDVNHQYWTNLKTSDGLNSYIKYAGGYLCVSSNSSEQAYARKVYNAIVLSDLDLTLNVGANYTLEVVANTSGTITWSSSNNSIATVSQDGCITALAAGDVNITATTSAGVTTYCKVSIAGSAIKVSNITLSKSELSIEEGKTATLVASITPENAENKKLQWSSNNESVATVDHNGKITAITVGETTIKATATDGSNVSASCLVTVTAKQAVNEDNYLSLSGLKVLVGEEYTLPIEMTNKTDICGIQFDLYLPAGISVATNSKGKYAFELTDREDGHSISSNLQADGSIRVMIVSTSNNTFFDNSGAILNMPIVVAEDAESGTRNIEIKNIILSDTQATKIITNDVTAELEICGYIIGDSNGDGEVILTDVVNTINYVIGLNPTSFIFAAADATQDGAVDITDVVKIINIILNVDTGTTSAPANRIMAAQEGSDYSLGISDFEIKAGETKTLYVNMTNVGEIVGFQFDIALPAGLSFAKNPRGRYILELTDRADDHTISNNLQTDGSLRILVASMNNYPFYDNSGNIIGIDITADETFAGGDIKVLNAILSDAAATKISIEDFSYTVGASGVNELNLEAITITTLDNDIIVNGVPEDCTIDIYNTGGYHIYSGIEHRISVPSKGVYFVLIKGKSYRVAVL